LGHDTLCRKGRKVCLITFNKEKKENKMNKESAPRFLTLESIADYLNYLREQERSAATIQKYTHDLKAAAEYVSGAELTKSRLLSWKEHLVEMYAVASVNSMLATLNGYLAFMGWNDLAVKALRVQRTMFLDEKRELTCTEYERLVHAAE